MAKTKFSEELRISLKDVTLIPAPGFLLIKKIEGAYLQTSGLIVPKSERLEGYLAEVIAVSPIPRIEYGVTIPQFVTAGAIVVLTTYASGQIMTKEDGETQLIQETHIAGVVDREEYNAVMAKAVEAQQAKLLAQA